MDHEAQYVMDGETALRVLELAEKARHARRMTAEFVRRWAVEQKVGEVGLVALSTGLIDLPVVQSDGAELISGTTSDS